jgi:hypothetical protein
MTYIERITTLLKVVDPINNQGVELAEVDGLQYVTWRLYQAPEVCGRVWAAAVCGQSETHDVHPQHDYLPAPRQWVRESGDYFIYRNGDQGREFAAAYADFKDRERRVRQSFENDAFANHVPGVS